MQGCDNPVTTISDIQIEYCDKHIEQDVVFDAKCQAASCDAPANVGVDNKYCECHQEKDAVNHPSHYTMGKFEVIDVIEDWGLEFHEANVTKYVARAKHKGKRLQDLKKAQFYLSRKISLLEAEEDGDI